MQTAGADPETGSFHVRAEVRNNRAKTVTVLLQVKAPEGWQQADTQSLNIEAGKAIVTDVVISPTATAKPGSLPVVLTAISGKTTARATARLLYIPPSANRLTNPGFEAGAWSGGEPDTGMAYSGTSSLRLHNPQRSNSQANQTVNLNQDLPCPILIRCASRAENVSGTKGRGYCLYIDIYYQDGTPLYGQTFPFPTGTTDWQVGEMIIEPKKPIKNVNVYLLLRNKSGTVWFDDVAVMEDPRRKGNIAREATVTVDSRYSGYSTVPINDGIVHVPKNAHWTDESWASADENKEHFIELAFAQVRKIAGVAIYWSLDAGVPKTSRQVRLQAPDGQGWRDVLSVSPSGLEEETAIILPSPLESARIRLLQPSGKGPRQRSGIMWVREVEVFTDTGIQ